MINLHDRKFGDRLVTEEGKMVVYLGYSKIETRLFAGESHTIAGEHGDKWFYLSSYTSDGTVIEHNGKHNGKVCGAGDPLNIVGLYKGGTDKTFATQVTNIQSDEDKGGTDKTFATQATNPQSDEKIYGSLLDKLFTTYKAKNHDYSNAFSEMFDELGIDYAYGKLREKMNRIKVLRNQPNMVENEGLEDALLDTAGYAILTLVELKKRK